MESARLADFAAPELSRGPNVREIVALYLAHVALRNQLGTYADSSLARARHYLGFFCDAFGNRPVADCCNSDLTTWLLDHPDWRSHATKSDAITAVISCFNWSVRNHKLKATPFMRDREMRIRPKPREPFSPDDYKRIMEEARNRPGRRKRPSATALRVALYFLWRSGARTCEMREILYRNVIFADGVIFLEHHKTEGATGEDRIIGLDDRLLRLINRLQRTRRANGKPCKCPVSKHTAHQKGEHVFVNGRGAPWSKDSFARLFRTFADLAGIDKRKSAYSLRHGFCVACIEAGVSDRAIADQMGQKGTRQISWYGRKSRQNIAHLREVVRRRNG